MINRLIVAILVLTLTSCAFAGYGRSSSSGGFRSSSYSRSSYSAPRYSYSRPSYSAPRSSTTIVHNNTYTSSHGHGGHSGGGGFFSSFFGGAAGAVVGNSLSQPHAVAAPVVVQQPYATQAPIPPMAQTVQPAPEQVIVQQPVEESHPITTLFAILAIIFLAWMGSLVLRKICA